LRTTHGHEEGSFQVVIFGMVFCRLAFHSQLKNGKWRKEFGPHHHIRP
jgi:hypothetical protein